MTPADEQAAFDAEQAFIRTQPHSVEGQVARLLTSAELAEHNARIAAFEARQLPDAQAAAIEKVNRDCGAFRASLATDIPFQGEAYKRKEAQARSFVQGVSTAQTHPYIFREANRTGVTRTALAAEIIALADQWDDLLSATEATRRGAIVAIGDATTVEQVAAAVPENWP